MLQIPKRRSGIVLGVNLDFTLLTRTAYVSHKKFFNPFATENDGAGCLTETGVESELTKFNQGARIQSLQASFSCF